MLLVAMILLGTIGLLRMPLSYLPLSTSPQLYATVTISRTSPEVLEREVVRPIEEEIATIRDLDRLQVASGSWGIRVQMEFEPGTDIDARKIELRDRIERLKGTLPDLVQNIQIGAVTNLDEPMMQLQLSSATDLSGDYHLLETKVVRRVESVPGVARVEFDGVAPPELEIEVDLDAAARHGVALTDLTQLLRDARQGRSLGQLKGEHRTLGLRAPVSPPAPNTLAPLPLRRGPHAADAHFATLDEVADVLQHPKDQRQGRRLNGHPAVQLGVFAQAGTSAVDVSRRVHAAIEGLASDPALEGIDVLVIEDQGETILRTLGDLRNSGIYGGLLGVVILYLFLRQIPITLVVGLSIPMSIVCAGAVLFLQGQELNCVVMLGLVLGVGMLIDNAVVMVEAIAKHAQRGEAPAEAVRAGAREVGFATIASTLSTVIVFIPLALSDPADPTSAYLRPLGWTFSIGLVASLLVSQTAIPLLMVPVLHHLQRARPRDPAPRRALIDIVARGYGAFIERTLARPRLTCLLGLACAASAVLPFREINYRIGRAEIQPDTMPLRLEIAGSRSFERIEGILRTVEAPLLARADELEIDAISCSFSDHWGQCQIYPRAPFDSERAFEAFQRRISDALPEQVGVRYRLGERNYDWHENSNRNAVDFVLRGDDMASLMQLAEPVADHLRRRLPRGNADDATKFGFDHITTPYDEGGDELQVVLARERLAALGIAPRDVASQVRLAFEGWMLGTVQGTDGELEMRLSVGEGDEKSGGLTTLRELQIPLPGGQSVPLGSIATIEHANRPWWIQRVDRQTEVHVVVHFFSHDTEENWAAVGRALADFEFPAGVSWGRGTRWFRQQEANHEMIVNLGLCLLLVYAVMASLFESFVQPFGILLVCLVGTFGAPWALLWTDTTLDTTAVIGFFILVGVVVNNGIMLIDKVGQLRSEGLGTREALRRAGHDRLRPILMTVTTTVLGLVPMLIHHPTLAGIYYHAVAIVVAGGLVTSTLMTLVLLPSTYTVLETMATTARGVWTRTGKPRR